MTEYKKVKLGDVCEQISGEWGKDCEAGESGTKVLRTTNFTNSGLVKYEDVVTRSIPENKVAAKKLQKGDIILEKSGGSDTQPVGRVVFFDRDDETFLCNNFTTALRISDTNVFSKYVFDYMFYMHKVGITEYYQNKTTGIHNLQTKAYLERTIPLPPLAEQKHIAAVLDKCSEVIALHKTMLAKYDTLIKSRFIEMFGDNPIENGKWKTEKLTDVCSLITDGTHQPPKFDEKGTIPFLFVSNIADEKIDYKTEKHISEETYKSLMKRTPVEIGDILLTIVGSYGHPAIVKENRPFSFQRHIAFLKPKRELLDSEYLHTAFVVPETVRQIEQKVKGIAQKTLNLSELKSIKIPLPPPLALQQEFADFVRTVDAQKSAVQKSLTKAETLYKSLMQEYFS